MERQSLQETRIEAAIQALKAADELVALLDRMCIAAGKQDPPLIAKLRYEVLEKRTLYDALKKRFEQ
jgi:hypothetical protein